MSSWGSSGDFSICVNMLFFYHDDKFLANTRYLKWFNQVTAVYIFIFILKFSKLVFKIVIHFLNLFFIIYLLKMLSNAVTVRGLVKKTCTNYLNNLTLIIYMYWRHIKPKICRLDFILSENCCLSLIATLIIDKLHVYAILYLSYVSIYEVYVSYQEVTW